MIEHVRTRPDARVLLTSVVEGAGSPLGFYLRQGFRATGAVHDGELVLERPVDGRSGDHVSVAPTRP